MFFKTTLLAIAALVAMPFNDNFNDLAIGDAIPAADKKSKDVSSKEFALNELMMKNGMCVIFSCNTCPFVVGSEGSEGWEGRYPALAEQCHAKQIDFVLVNSNAAKREMGDGFADMQKHYTEKNYAGYYLLDEGSLLADAFGARTTPHVFLFDGKGKLAYKGAIDDNVDDPKAVTKHYLHDAIEALAAGKAIDPATTRNLGCSIKRVAVPN